MKRTTLTLCTLLIACTAFAQLRLVGYHKYTNTTNIINRFQSADSLAISYAANNKNAGGYKNYTEQTLKYTEALRRSGLPNNHLPISKIENVYDTQWNLIKRTETIPYPANYSPLTNSRQQLYQYDAKGNETLELELHWNHTTSQWDSFGRQTTIYDANGNITTYNIELYLNNTYQGYKRYNYDHDTKNNMVLQLIEDWDVSNMTYDSTTRILYSYNSNNNVDTQITQDYIDSTKQWSDYERRTYTYASGQITTLLIQYWDTNTNTWYDARKEETYYNVPFYGTYTEFSAYNNFTQSWYINKGTCSMPVSANPRVEDELYFFGPVTAPNSFPLSRVRKTYNSDNYLISAVSSNWDNMKKVWESHKFADSSIYWYEDVSTLSTSNINLNAPQVSLYPNPASSFINIAVSQANNNPYTISIYSIEGRLMMQQHVADGTATRSIPTAHLSNGQYILSISTQQGKTPQQFSVLR